MRNLFNLANLLSFSRILLAIPLAIFIAEIDSSSSVNDVINVVVICLLIAVTDVFDGFLARKLKLVTEFGQILDPVSDKILIFSVLITLSYKNFIELPIPHDFA